MKAPWIHWVLAAFLLTVSVTWFRASRGLAQPSHGTLASAHGGACFYANCGQTNACIPQDGGGYKYYYYKLGTYAYVRTVEEAAGAPADCLEVRDHDSATCNDPNSKLDPTQSLTRNGCP